MSSRTAGMWAGVLVAASLTGCNSAGSPTGMAATRPNSQIPTRTNPSPTAVAAVPKASTPTDASAWNAPKKDPAPTFSPTGNQPASAVNPTSGIQPASGIAPAGPIPFTMPPAGSTSKNVTPGALPNPTTVAEAAKPEVTQVTANMPRPADMTRSSIAVPKIDEAVMASALPMPVPATMEVSLPQAPVSNGLTVQPVLLNPAPVKVRQ